MAACPNVTYGMWTNGVERFCYRRMVSDGVVNFEDVPDIPEFGRGDEDQDRLHFDQLKPATSDTLLFAFRRCHNYIAGNQGLQKPQAFWELLKLIFCKIHDERHSDEVQFFTAANERHGVNGPLKVQKRIEALFTQVKNDYPAMQLAALKKAGCKTISTDDGLSGATAKRPALRRCLKKLEPGDTLTVWKLDRLGRSLRDLIAMLDDLKQRGVKFRSLTEAIDTDTPTGRAMWQMIGVLAELERNLIIERTRAGIQAAKRRGVKFGRKLKLTPQQIGRARKLIKQGEAPQAVASLLRVSRATIYRALA